MSNILVAIAGTSVVSRALYDAALKELAAARQMAARYGLSHCSPVEAINALGKYADMHGWDSTNDLDEYRDWLQTVDDMQGRM
jgi:hypothetical protein